MGFEVRVEAEAGLGAAFADDDYVKAGATIVTDSAALWAAADVLLKVQPPSTAEAGRLKAGATLICFLWPAKNKALIDDLAARKVNALAIDQVPRITRAQKMDALSSMANIAGYRAVVEAASFYGRFFTGQMTAAGKVPAAKVLVIGAGVAGLAAIGTATSLGAITYAFDVRPEVAEQIESMGAQFVYLDFEEAAADGAATGGYAAHSSPEFRGAAQEVPRARTRHRHRHHHRADPRPPGPQALDRGDGRGDEAGLGRGRPRRRARRQPARTWHPSTRSARRPRAARRTRGRGHPCCRRRRWRRAPPPRRR